LVFLLWRGATVAFAPPPSRWRSVPRLAADPREQVAESRVVAEVAEAAQPPVLEPVDLADEVTEEKPVLVKDDEEEEPAGEERPWLGASAINADPLVLDEPVGEDPRVDEAPALEVVQEPVAIEETTDEPVLALTEGDDVVADELVLLEDAVDAREDVVEDMVEDVVEDVVEDMVEDVVEDIVEAVEENDAIEDVVEDAVEDIVEAAVEENDAIEDVVVDVVEDIVEAAVEDVVEEAEEAIEDVVVDVVEDIVEAAVEDVVEEAEEAIEDVVVDVVEDIVEAAVEDVVEEAEEAIEDVIEDVVEDVIEAAVEDVVDEAEEAIEDVIEDVVEDVIEAAVEDLVDEAEEDAILDVVEDVVEDIIIEAPLPEMEAMPEEASVEDEVLEAVAVETAEEPLMAAPEPNVEASVVASEEASVVVVEGEEGEAVVEDSSTAESLVVKEAVKLSEEVLADFSERTDRTLEVARLQTLLERSQSRRRQVESVVAEELAALRAQLDRELVSERERSLGVGSLLGELERTLEVKRSNVDREKRLLVQLQDVAQRTQEAAIKASIERAVETKAGLVAIEMMLIEDIEECTTQVEVEGREIDRRVRAMTDTRESLPAVDDTAALRSYSWSQVEDLENQLKASAVAVAETDAKVRILRARIADALNQRDAVLGGSAIQGAASWKSQQRQATSTKALRALDDSLPPRPSPYAAATNVPRGGAPLRLNLQNLDDRELAEAVATSAAAAADRLADLGGAVMASFGSFVDSDESKEVAFLLSDASNTTKFLVDTLRGAAALGSKSTPNLLPEGASSSETNKNASTTTTTAGLTDQQAEQLAAETAQDVARISKDVGKAVLETASGLASASKENSLGKVAGAAVSAVSATALSASLLAFRKAKQAFSLIAKQRDDDKSTPPQ